MQIRKIEIEFESGIAEFQVNEIELLKIIIGEEQLDLNGKEVDYLIEFLTKIRE